MSAREDAFLIFSGHNPRAVVTMCRYLSRVGIPFCCVASNGDDPILTSIYNKTVLFRRDNPSIDVDLFRRASEATKYRLIYCPSTEFINMFVLANRDEIETAGVRVRLPDADIYRGITEKRSSAGFFKNAPGITLPAELPIDAPTFPCVVKPLENIADDRAYYPIICHDEMAFSDALELFTTVGCFVQEYITGESLYFCGNITAEYEVIGFWQQNLMQQPGGKSVVFAVEDIRAHERATEGVKHALRASGYVGPFMVELLLSDSSYHYIETNPRLWGPLQLTMDVMPNVLDAFCRLYGFEPKKHLNRVDATPAYYIWSDGTDENAHRHIGLSKHPNSKNLAAIWDVFARPDFNDAA